MTPYHIGMTRQFRSALDDLPPVARAEVVDAALKVSDGHPSVDVHKLEGCAFVAFRVNRNALRVIALRDGDTLILLHVDAHDPAYAWAKRHRVARIGDVLRFVSVATEHADDPEPNATEPTSPGPLADVRDRTFALFGVGPHAAAALRRVVSDDEIVELAETMRPPLAAALIGLATDPDDLQALVRAFEDAQAAPGPAPLPTVAEAARSPSNAGDLWLAPSARALEAVLDGSWREWQVFLHPSQRGLVHKRFAGAAKVTGGPGTGKTVVAVHRARFLAEVALVDDPRPVLVTTFGGTLCDQLDALVGQACEDAPGVRARIEVRTLLAASRAVLARAGRPSGFVADGDAVCAAAWDEAMRHDALGLARAFYEAERTQVVARAAAWSEAEYLGATRSGRPERLDRAKRRAVWRVIEAFDHALAASGGGDAIALAREAERVVRADPDAAMWSAVVCDEVQDATVGDLRLLAALTARPGTAEIGADRLFLCGDGYQRLYTTAISLSACGIEVRGRSRQLRLNYRTTEGIRRAAVDVVRGVDVDALDQASDAPEDGADALDAYRSLRGGPPPERRTFPDEASEAAWIASTVRQGPVLVLARTAAYRDRVAERLRAAGIEPRVLVDRGELDPDGITLCTLHRSKGLEAPSVVIAGAHLVGARFPGGAVDRAAWERQERCLLYVGMTRARDRCAIGRVASES